MMRRLSVVVCLALCVVFGVEAAQANSTLFIVTSKEHRLPDREGVSRHLKIPVRTLETGGVDEITSEINASLQWVGNYNEASIIPQMDRLKREASSAIAYRKGDLHKAYTTELQIGEISSRYHVTALPSVLQFDSKGNFRKSVQPASLASAISEIESQGWSAAPPKLGEKVAPGENSASSLASISARSTLVPDSPDLSTESSAQSTPGTAIPSYGNGTSYSVIKAVVDGMSTDSFACVDAKISGVCAYFVVRLYCSPFGCDVKANPEASIRLTHSNPELIIGAYKRLGASPIKESRLLFGDVQNKASGLGIKLLTGMAVPADYDDPDKWAGTASEATSVGSRKTLKFHEVDVMGHPGTLLQYVHADDLDPIPEYTDSLKEAPENIIGSGVDIQQTIAQSGTRAQSTVASVSPAPPAGLESLVPGKAQLQMIAEQVLPNGMAGAASSMLSFGSAVTPYINASMSGGVSGVIDAVIGEASQSLSNAYAELQGTIDMIENVGSSIDMPGMGAGGTELWSFCPGAGRFMKPYMLSGLDILQWRFNLPEIVNPLTYAIPIPRFKHLVVGTPGNISGAGIDLPNNWGMIYPRLGYVQQPDELKAAMVTAARAAHVVTRTGQKHVYSPLEPRNTKHLDVTYPPPFDPSDRVSGKWQMVAPRLDNQCYVFGEADTELNPWSAYRMSDDQAYAMTLWREFSCCPTPRKMGAVTMVDISLGFIPFEIQLIQ